MAYGVRANYGVLSTFGVASDFGVLPQYGAGDGATLDAAFSAFASADYTPTADGGTTDGSGEAVTQYTTDASAAAGTVSRVQAVSGGVTKTLAMRQGA